MARYAQSTSVSVEKSRAEIESTLTRYGATAFAYAWQGSRASIQFEAKDRRIRFMLPLPDKTERRFTHAKHARHYTEKPRTPEAALKEWEQACRQAWRALALVIKAKLEAVAAEITSFEDEFLAQIVLPDGKTVADHAKPEIAIAYQRGEMRPMLPGPKG